MTVASVAGVSKTFDETVTVEDVSFTVLNQRHLARNLDRAHDQRAHPTNNDTQTDTDSHPNIIPAPSTLPRFATLSNVSLHHVEAISHDRR